MSQREIGKGQEAKEEEDAKEFGAKFQVTVAYEEREINRQFIISLGVG